MNEPVRRSDYRPPTPADLTKEQIEQAIHISTRYERNLANTEGSTSFPVPAATARLMALTILRLATELGLYGKKPASVPSTEGGQAGQKTGKALTQTQPGPALSEEQGKALTAVQGLLAAKQVVTTRAVAEAAGWKSHNSAARHLKSLTELGYLKKVGKGKNARLAQTGLQP